MGKIKRVIRASALASDEVINRMPIGSAKLLEGIMHPGRGRVGGCGNNAPVRGRKLGTMPLIPEEMLIGRCHAAANWVVAGFLAVFKEVGKLDSACRGLSPQTTDPSGA